MMADQAAEVVSEAATQQPTNGSCEIQQATFELLIHNTLKHKSHKELKSHLNSLGLQPRRVQVQFDHAYVSFGDEEGVCAAVAALNGHQWKGKLLRVKRTKPCADKNFHKNNMEKRPKLQNDPENGRGEEKIVDWQMAVVQSSTPLALVPYEQQLEMKQQESYKLLKKISWEIRKASDIQPKLGEHHYGTLEKIRPSPVQDGYRSKCEFTVGSGPEGTPEVGFLVSRFRSGSCTVVSADCCKNVPDMVKRALAPFREYLRSDRCSLPVYSMEANEGFWRMLTAKFFKFDLMLIVTVNERNFPVEKIAQAKQHVVDLFFNSKDGTSNPDLRVTSLFWSPAEFHSENPVYEKIAGTPFVYENVMNCRFRISPGTFFQINTSGCNVLYGILIDYLKSLNSEQELSRDETKNVENVTSTKNGTLLFDVCCGVGSIGICASDHVKKVVGIEIIEQAVKDAQINALCNEKNNCEFLAGRAEEIFMDLQKQKLIDFDRYQKVVAILDPPRKGLGDKIIGCLRECSAITSILYVSCDPRGASKNFVDLCRRPSKRYPGVAFELKRVVPVDLFPHTNHFEWAMFFDRPFLSLAPLCENAVLKSEE